MSAVTHLTIIGEPDQGTCRTWDRTGGPLTQDWTQATCPECRESWAYAVAQRRAALPSHWEPVSVEPAANFGSGHGLLAVSESGQPDRIVIEQADRLVYIPNEWVMRAFYGKFPWATFAPPVLKIQGTDRKVIYEDTGGGCGPRVKATIFEQPD